MTDYTWADANDTMARLTRERDEARADADALAAALETLVGLVGPPLGGHRDDFDDALAHHDALVVNR